MKRKRDVQYYERQNLTLALLITIPFLILVGFIITSKTFQIGGELVARVDTDQKVVALTFDDGPEPPHSDEVLRILSENDIQATFFLIGIEMQRYPSQTKRIVSSGHEVGNHSYKHNSLVFRSKAAIALDIEKTDSIIRQSGYGGAIPVRPPYGHKFVSLPSYLAENNRPTIMWNIAPDENGEASANEIVDSTMTALEPGSIIILHAMYDHTEPTRQALPELISRVKAEGYRFVTISELLQY